MKRIRLTEDKLKQIIREVVVDAMNGGNDDIAFATQLVEQYKDKIIKEVYRNIESWGFDDMRCSFDDRRPNYGPSYGSYEEDVEDIECDFSVGNMRLRIYAGCHLDVTMTPGDPGDYWTPPTYDDYDYEISDIYVDGLYYCDDNREIDIYEDDFYIALT